MNYKINEIKRQIMLTSWDIPLIKDEKIKMLKEQKLEELKRELAREQNQVRHGAEA